MARGRDDRSLQRRGPVREPLPRILIVCEGKVTERQYIDGFRVAQGITTVRVEVVSPGGDPQALVERAIGIRDASRREARRARDANLAYDEAWCVIDVDQHARLETARRLAHDAGIQLAVSNPCFELWLLLHFADYRAHVNADRAMNLLRKHLDGYDKHLRYADLAPGYEAAVRRARILEAQHREHDAPGGNPSTDVHLLTEHIRQFGRSSRT